MIEISLTQALAVYSAVLGLTIGVIWLYTELSIRRPQRLLGEQFLWRCSFCGCTYLDEGAQQVSKCPRCESFNAVEEAARRANVAQVEAPREADETAAGRNTSRRKRHHQRRRGPRRRR